MIFASSNLLGIAVTDRTIACAEISGKGERVSIKKAATFTLPAEVSLDKPDSVGPAFATFLKQQGFSASRAVVGVPARWLIAVEKDVPPSGREQMRSLLRLQAERLPLAESGELVFDYAGQHDSARGGKILLVAMLRKQLENLEQTMKLAGVSIAAVTPTTLALANAAASRSAPAGRNAPLLVLGRNSAEVVLRQQGNPRLLRHFAVATTNGQGAAAMSTLGIDVRRAVAIGSGTQGSHGPQGPAEEILLCDGMGLDPTQVAELSERLGLKIRSGDGLDMLGIKTVVRKTKATTEDGDWGQLAPAVALAIAGGDPVILPFDFIKSRLAPPRVRRFGKKAVWIGTIAALLLIAIAGMYVDVSMLQRQLDDIQKQRTELTPKTNAAKEIQGRVNLAANFYEGQRSPVLDSLARMAISFDGDVTILATNFNVKEETDSKDPGRVEGQLEGRAVTGASALALADRMRADPKFANVTGPNITKAQAGRGQQAQVTFTIKFSYSEHIAAVKKK